MMILESFIHLNLLSKMFIMISHKFVLQRVLYKNLPIIFKEIFLTGTQTNLKVYTLDKFRTVYSFRRNYYTIYYIKKKYVHRDTPVFNKF